MKFEADASGLVEQVAREGDTLPAGALIAGILSASERSDNGSAASASGGGVEAFSSQGLATDAPPHAPNAAGAGRAKPSPSARRSADERALDLSSLEGAGVKGPIVKRDVEYALASGSASTERDVATPLSIPLSGGSPSTSSPAQAGASQSSLASREPPSAPCSRGASAGSLPEEEATESTEEAEKRSAKTVEPSELSQTVGRRMAESEGTAPYLHLQAEIDLTAAWDACARIKVEPLGLAL